MESHAIFGTLNLANLVRKDISSEKVPKTNHLPPLVVGNPLHGLLFKDQPLCLVDWTCNKQYQVVVPNIF